MAIQNASDSQKVDYLWKKIGYGVAKTDISGNIDATNEPYASPLLIRADTLWQQSGSIPNVAPTSNVGVVTAYPTTFPIQCTNDAGIPTPNLTWVTGVTNWIPPEFGSTYQIKVYIAPAGQAANVLTKGTQVFATGSGNNDLWYFDYKAGILNFNSNNTPYAGGVPISFTGNAVYISGGVYSGLIGLPNGIGNLTVSNTTISSLGGNISFNSASGYIYAGNAIIANIANPINSQDAVTVSNLLSAIGSISSITGNLNVTNNLTVGGYANITGNLSLSSTSDLLISGNAGLNGQYLTSTGNGLQWTTVSFNSSQISSGASNVTVTANYVNVAINGSNVASFSSTGFTTGNLTISNSTLSSVDGANLVLNAPGTGIVQIAGSDALGLPYGNIYTRPGNPTIGYIRYNTDAPGLEVWTGNAWLAPGTAQILSQTIFPDGVSNVFTLSSNASTTGVLVSLNGTLQRPGYAYTVSNNSIAFSEVPLTTDIVEVRYMINGQTVVSASQLQYGNTTSVVLDATNVTVTSQNINQSGNLSVQGNITSGTLQTGVTHIPTSANVIYVAKNGNDSFDGTINAPFLTIKAALAAAANISTSGVSVHVAPGTYYENNPVTIPQNVSLMGDNIRNITVIPNTPTADLFYVTNGCYVWGITIKNYLANGFSYSSATSSANVFVSPYIQNITSSTTTGTAVYVDGNNTSSISTKAMIVGFFTIINQGGVGVRLSNGAYAQLVNIYTIGANVGIWSDSGSFCTLNGSDNSIGNIGLRADGYGTLQSYGNTSGYSTFGSFTIKNPTAQPHVNTVMIINGDPAYYSIDKINKVDAVTYTITVQQTYLGNLAPNTNIAFYNRSEVVASAHTFEYVGAGTNAATALPQYGGIPNANLNVVTTGGGSVTYTATDEKGQFWIGPNLVINQATGTISGAAFSKSLFALMTPYILALEI